MDHAALYGMYLLKNTIGSGGFGKVKLAFHIATGDKVAIKIMNKKSLGKDLPRVKTEIEALKVLNHKNICRLYQAIETEDFFYIVLEYCQGGELFDYIVAKDKLSEAEARNVFREIVEAVSYIHARGFVHRDLKPENLLLDEDQNIKLIDFGLCAKPEGGLETALKTCCGSPAYAAPELILGRNYIGTQVDLWSMGVLLYSLLCGFLPFDDKNLSMLYKKILNGKYHSPKWLSKESLDLLKGLLQVNPSKRFTVKDVVLHPWLNKGYLYPVETSFDFQSDVLDDDCLTEMSVHYGMTKQEMRVKVIKWNFDYLTSTYLLLLKKKSQGHPIRLVRPQALRANRVQSGPMEIPTRNGGAAPVARFEDGDVEVNDDVDDDNVRPILNYFPRVTARPKCVQQLNFDRVDPRLNELQESVSLRPPDRRSEEVELKSLEEEKKENFPFVRPRTPKARHRPISANGRNPPLPNRVQHEGTPRPPRICPVDRHSVLMNPLSPSRSMDSQLNNFLGNNSNSDRSCINNTVPSSSLDSDMNQMSIQDEDTPSRSKSSRMANSVFGSIERGMDRLIGMLTPKKCTGSDLPRLVKRSIHNVFGLSNRDPDKLIQSLESVITKIGISYKRNGYFIKFKYFSGKDKVKMQLEIVVMPSEYCGYIAKRLKGSSWLYKHCCDTLNRELNILTSQPL